MKAKLIQPHNNLPIGTVVTILEDDDNNPCYWVVYDGSEFYIEKRKVEVINVSNYRQAQE